MTFKLSLLLQVHRFPVDEHFPYSILISVIPWYLSPSLFPFTDKTHAVIQIGFRQTAHHHHHHVSIDGPPYSLITWSALIVLRFRRCNRNHQNCLGGWLNRNHLVFTNHRPMTHHPEGQSPPHLLPEEHLMTHQFFPYLFPIFLSYHHHQLNDGKEFRSRIPSHDPSSTPTEFPQ